MNISRAALTSYVLVCVFGFALTFGVGCNDRAANPVGDGGLKTTWIESPTFMGDTSGCNTVSSVLLPAPPLVLELTNSQVRYPPRSVIDVTVVSFGICDLDTTGTTFYPKCQALGPISNLVFRDSVSVKLNYDDAGLPGVPVEDRAYNVFRRNELNGDWDLHAHARVSNGTVKYKVIRNGLYAITRDSVWFTTGIATPDCPALLPLLNSSLLIPTGAVSESTTVSFAITQTTPVGLPGATNRVFDFGPEGLVFLVPVTLYVSYADAGIESDKTSPLRFYYFDTVTSTWVPQPTAIDWNNRRFVVTLSHFSRYAFGR